MAKDKTAAQREEAAQSITALSLDKVNKIKARGKIAATKEDVPVVPASEKKEADEPKPSATSKEIKQSAKPAAKKSRTTKKSTTAATKTKTTKKSEPVAKASKPEQDKINVKKPTTPTPKKLGRPITTTTGEKIDDKMLLYMTSTMKEEIELLAGIQKMSANALIRKLIENYLKSDDAKAKLDILKKVE